MGTRAVVAAALSGVIGACLALPACSTEKPTSCSYSVSVGSVIDGASAGGSYSVGVTTSSGCTWAAASTTSWIHVTAPASGSGSGTAAFTVDANTGAARSGTLTVAGVAITFNQAAATYALTVTLAQGSNLSGPYAALLTGPGGFSCTLGSLQQSVACPSASYAAGTLVQLVLTITNPSFANADPFFSTSGCDSVTVNTCAVLMNAGRSVTIRAGKL